MEKKLILTADGSHTVTIPELNVCFHSIHGALQESRHVFIEAGLNYMLDTTLVRPLRIFEMALGTGLNVLLTAVEAEKKKTKIEYHVIEPFPLSLDFVKELNYPEQVFHRDLLLKIHECNWAEDVPVSDYLTLRKEPSDLSSYSAIGTFNLVYYDAFAPMAQPELWTREIFGKLHEMLERNGVLVTYCSKGDVRRAMTAAGFSVKKLPGPPGKREMLRATKT